MNTVLKHTNAEQDLLSLNGEGAGAAFLREKGLPTRRVEAWHYTDLRTLLKAVPAKADNLTDADVDAVLSSYRRLTNSIRFPFINGQFLAGQADATPNGLFVATHEGATGFNGDRDDAIGLIGNIAQSSGLNLTVKEGITLEQSIGLAQVLKDDVLAGTAHCVTVGKNANVSFIERHLGDGHVAGQVNATTELSVEAGSKVLWAIVQEHGPETTHLGQLKVTLSEDAELTILILNCGGKLVRQEIDVACNGENANLEILGVNLVGDGAHVDVTTCLSHNVPNTNAEETFRNVVTGSGRGVFQGQIKVAQPAQKTDAQMACNTLLLSDQSDFSAKPELEIFADDVVCAHGATVTDIDEDHLFYMRARGIPESEARALLVKAFVDEIFDDLEDETFKEALVGRIDDWLDKNG